jgi:hypothetical protein
MTTLDRLRPPTRPLDAEWSARTLETILTTPAPARHSGARRRLALTGAAVAGLLGLGGVAYAADLVPSAITDHFAETSSAEVTGVRRLASFTTTKNGPARSFEIWRGTDADGRDCIAVWERETATGPDFSGNCGDRPTDAWFNTTSESYALGDTPPPTTYYVYGEPALDGVTAVRVVGDHFAHTVAVDATTGGYAVAVPELDRGVSGRFATVEFLDEHGTVVGTRVLSEK